MYVSPLTVLLAVGFLGTLLTFLSGKWARWTAVATTLALSLLVVYLLTQFNLNDSSGYQFLEVNNWFTFAGLNGGSGISVDYAVGMDGISLPLVLLSAVVTLAAVVYHWEETDRPHAFFGLLLLVNAGVLGVFLSLDALLFFVFWEVVLIPMFFLIGGWGGARRHYAALKFFVYTHVASVVMFVSLLVMIFLAGWGTFDFVNLYGVQSLNQSALSSVTQVLLFASMLFGFGVKLPMVPFHTWLPDAHVEAPTGGSVLLAAVLLKMGAYGLIRIAMPLLPTGREVLTPLIFFFAFLSIVWGAYLSLAQRDLKRLVAYSSINHMGIVLLAIGLWTQIGIEAAVLLMFAHGLVSAMLFMVSGSMHHAYGTRDIPSVGGMSAFTPRLSTMVVMGSLASLGLPALVSFPAEFSAFFATWESLGYWVLIPLMALVITAAFYIWMLQRLSFGPPRGATPKTHDLPTPELAALAILGALVVLYGILPFLIAQYIPATLLFHLTCFPGGGGVCP